MTWKIFFVFLDWIIELKFDRTLIHFMIFLYNRFINRLFFGHFSFINQFFFYFMKNNSHIFLKSSNLSMHFNRLLYFRSSNWFELIVCSSKSEEIGRSLGERFPLCWVKSIYSSKFWKYLSRLVNQLAPELHFGCRALGGRVFGQSFHKNFLNSK